MIFATFFLIFVTNNLALAQPTTQPMRCAILEINLSNGTCPAESTGQLPCRELCTGAPITGENNCSDAVHCCFVNNTCITKQPVADVHAMTDEELAENIRPSNDSRLFPFALPGVSRFTIDQLQELAPGFDFTPKFPFACRLNFSVVQPTINIPYCQRIACDSSNPFLESDPLQCIKQPGCAYDQSLSIYRSFLQFGIFPGVPICHLAIRNTAFLSRALQITLRQGEWNPVLTECIISHYSSEVLTNPTSCNSVDVLQQLGYNAKRAGWIGITERECYLINGCWLRENCYYGYEISQIKKIISPETDNFDIIEEGKPMCLPFSDNLSPGEYLTAYHTCLSSGCVAKTSTLSLLKQLYDVTTANLPRQLQYQYWTMALLGQVRADNWKEVALKLIGENKKNHALRQIFSRREFSFGSPATANGEGLLPFSLRLNSNEKRSLSQNSFLIYNSFGLFDNDRTSPFRTNRSRFNETENINLENFSQKINPHSATSKEWRNLRRLLSGISSETFPSLEPNISFPCRFQPISWPNFPPLMGKLDGCCENPFCYLPRMQIRNAKSVIASYSTEWTIWGPCSVSCGSGTQSRFRSCIGDLCNRTIYNETQACNVKPCSRFGPWSAFSPCNATCGLGSISRVRFCLGPGECSGESRQTRRCQIMRCNIIMYENWSSCSRSCGKGTQRRRTLSCNGNGNCRRNSFDRRPCETFCGTYHYVNKCNRRTCLNEPFSYCILPNGMRGGNCNPETRRPPPTRQTQCLEGPCCRRIHGRNSPRCYRN